jgi:hypothetical protein
MVKNMGRDGLACGRERHHHRRVAECMGSDGLGRSLYGGEGSDVIKVNERQLAQLNERGSHPRGIVGGAVTELMVATREVLLEVQ